MLYYYSRVVVLTPAVYLTVFMGCVNVQQCERSCHSSPSLLRRHSLSSVGHHKAQPTAITCNNLCLPHFSTFSSDSPGLGRFKTKVKAMSKYIPTGKNLWMNEETTLNPCRLYLDGWKSVASFSVRFYNWLWCTFGKCDELIWTCFLFVQHD